MIVVFNQLPVLVGTQAASFNVFVERAASATAEILNEAIWLVNVDL